MKNYFDLIEQLIIIFTIVLVILGCTIIYLFLFIQKQKEIGYKKRNEQNNQ